MSLVDVNGDPLGATETRRARVSKTYKDTPKGRVYFGLKIDMPQGVSEDEFKRLMIEFGDTLKATFEREL